MFSSTMVHPFSRVLVCSGWRYKYHKWNGLATEMYVSQFERLEVRNQGPGRVASSEASLLALQMTAFSLSSHGHFSV